MNKNLYFTLLKELVAINTISSDDKSLDQSNLPLIEYAKNIFEQNDYKTQIFKVSEGKYNLLASFIVDEKDRGMLLAGHSDTVPCKSNDWTYNPFTLTLKDNCAYGLGSCDMKGFIALMLYMAQTLDKTSLKHGLSFLITADEETSMNGAIDFAKKHNEQYSLIVIGEPTELMPMIAHKGYICGQYCFKGKSCHSSNPSLGLNALNIAYEAMGYLYDLQEKLKSYTDDRFHVPYSTLNIGALHGGDCSNRLCDSATLLFDIRPTGTINTDFINPLLDEITHKLKVKFGHDNIEFKKVFADIDSFLNTNKVFIDNIESITNKKAIFEAYCTEASFLQALGPVIVYGAGSIKHAHRIDEHINLDDVVEYYTNLQKLSLAYA